MKMQKTYAIGVDLGGTNTVFGIVDAQGTIVAQDSIKTQAYKTAEAFVEAGVACLRPLIEQVGGIANLAGMGIGAPNANYYSGAIETAPNIAWAHDTVVPLAQMFSEKIRPSLSCGHLPRNGESHPDGLPPHYGEGLGRGSSLDFVITEVGGTIGDIESAPFMEAIRQLRWQLGRNAVCVHLTYVPYLKAADELKTKPTQHSVKELQSMGIQPDILVLRTERHLDDSLRMKVASFCNVDLECVVQSEDLPSIYEVPVNMQRQGLDAAILRKIGIPVGETPAMKPWHDFLDKQHRATREVHVALVGKYDLQDAYKSIRESLNLAGIYCGVKVKAHFVDSEDITPDNVEEKLSGMAGAIICPGFGQRGTEGKITAIQHTRTHNIPTFGICLGMQMMVIEFARHVLGHTDANSTEMTPDTQHPVIDLMEEQKTITGMGGTMRLGAYPCQLREGSKTHTIYGKSSIQERHRHRYEFNNRYLTDFEQHGMQCVGTNPDSHLVEVVELPDHPWFIGTQFHPEYASTVLHPHPLFMDFVRTLVP